jgi:putative methionine-R-sulfoxide reductase with GAF domain
VKSSGSSFVNGKNIGQIDDSHVLDPFTEADENFLEFVNQKLPDCIRICIKNVLSKPL